MNIIKRLVDTKNIWTVIPTVSAGDLEKVIKIASDKYYNTDEELITDSLYDVLVERLKIIKPNSSVLKVTGAPAHGEKTKLPYWMGSMDKIKGDEATLDKWLTLYEGPYIVSYKVDGISALFVKDNGKCKLYTRGKGTEGMEITHLLKMCNVSLDGVPDNVAIRGELIMSKENFEKYESLFSNARAMVSGIVVSKPESVTKSHAKDIDFLTFEVIKPHYTPSKQLKMLEKWGTTVVTWDEYDIVEIDLLEDLFNEAKDSCEYEADGIVVTDDNDHPRNTSGNPEYSFAYKGMTPMADVKVLDVIWTASKDGILVPRIRYKKTKLSGVEMEYTTGFNAAFINDNMIGPGAIITIIRSGDVIPYIIDVVKPSEPGLPTEYDYEWDKNNVNIVIADKENDTTVIIKRITKFMKDIGVKNVSEGVVTRLVDNGYDDVFKILKMGINDFVELDGFQDTLAKKLYNNIQSKIHNVDILQLMVASNLVGRGFAEKKLKKILQEYPDIVDEYDDADRDEWYDAIIQIDGYDDITTSQFLDNLVDFQKFYAKMKKVTEVKPFISKIKSDGLFMDQKVVFTGFKNAEWKKYVENEGGKVTESVSKNTTLVVHKDGETETAKYTKAQKLGTKLMSKTQFSKKYDL